MIFSIWKIVDLHSSFIGWYKTINYIIHLHLFSSGVLIKLISFILINYLEYIYWHRRYVIDDRVQYFQIHEIFIFKFFIILHSAINTYKSITWRLVTTMMWNKLIFQIERYYWQTSNNYEVDYHNINCIRYPDSILRVYRIYCVIFVDR